MNLLQSIEREWLQKRERTTTDVRPGDLVKVHGRIQEGDKSRLQSYEGTVIAIHKAGWRSSFTVRKISAGIGVERIFPASCPNVARIEVVARHKVRRAKLTFLRDVKGKAARLKPIVAAKK